MTAQELIDTLKKFDGRVPVFMSSDSEGNNYAVLHEVDASGKIAIGDESLPHPTLYPSHNLAE